MSNREIRERILRMRLQLSAQERDQLSYRIQEKLVVFLNQWIFKKNQPKIGMYRATRTEVNVDPIADRILKHQGQVAFPICLTDFQMNMVRVSGPDPLKESRWSKTEEGVWEPLERSSVLSPAQLDCLLIPGIVFSKNGYRLGRGKGYYDRYLARARQAIFVGVGFEFQVVEEGLKAEKWDVPMDVLVTEDQTRAFSSFEEKVGVKF